MVLDGHYNSIPFRFRAAPFRWQTEMPRNFSSIPGAFWCRAGAGISAPFPVSVSIHRDFGGHGGIPWELKFRPCAQGWCNSGEPGASVATHEAGE